MTPGRRESSPTSNKRAETMLSRLIPIALAGAVWLAPPPSQAAPQWNAAEPGQTALTSRRAILYQGRNRGQEETERFSRKLRLVRNGSVTVDNISGDIVVTAGSTDDVAIEALKRTRGGRGDLGSVRVDVSETPSRVDIRTAHTTRNDHVSVDYTITMPASGSLELHSISGNLKITGVHGSVRAETVSGNITTS